MEPYRCDEQFNAISQGLLDINPDDLLGMSDLIDSIRALQSLSPAPELTVPLIEAAAGALTGILRGEGKPETLRTVSEGLDLAHLCFRHLETGTDRGLPAWLADAVGTFLEAEARDAAGDAGLAAPDRGPGRAVLPEAGETAGMDGPGTHPAINDSRAAEIITIFLHESGERLASAQTLILELEQDGTRPGKLNELFRIFHTIKGEAGFLNLPQIGSLTHQVENVLDQLRQRKAGIDSGVIDLLLETVDCTVEMISAVTEGNPDRVHHKAADLLDRMYRKLRLDRPLIGQLMVRKGLIGEQQVSDILKKQRESGFLKRFGELSIEQNLVAEEDLRKVLKTQDSLSRTDPAVLPASGQEEGKLQEDQIVNVKASQIRYLIDMVGELTISLGKLDETNRDVAAARKISRTLQGAAMRLGTVTVGNLFRKMYRVVRDSSRHFGREVELEFSGEELEVDRSLVDSLGEPLMHLLRNAVAHGIEESCDRTASGKPATGKILLRAERKGHQVVISVEDDGRGLSEERILRKAVERNLISADQAAGMSREAAWDLIFIPGFSTADAVDAVAGRGVGMDVVKTYVASQRGHLTVESEPGVFTRISMAFPINMAIIEGMIARLRDQFFVFPVMNIVETLELSESMFHTLRDGVKIITCRDRTIPLIDLASFFELPARSGGGRIVAIIVEVRETRYAFLVDEILAKREVVIKSLGPVFAGRRGIASGTILQKGKIGLVLDVDEIVAVT